MRNLKKILALVLALVMSFSLMATANAFTDDEKITDTYETAVTVLSGLKVFQGYDDGSFLPQGSITRAEVAAIIYRIVTGDVNDTQVGIYADYNKFDDVKSTSWYAGYVNFCANAEYIKGYDAKTFGPNDPVTGYQALAMILRALGYDKNGEFTGASWQVQTAAVGENRGITKNITAGTLGVAATREVVAEILFRAILVEKVNYTPAFGYQLDDTSIGWDTFELEEITGVVVANEYADLYDTEALKAGKTELDVDGESYMLDYTTTLTDIGEARSAYITEGKNVLVIGDAGNTVFETGAATDISTDKKFESATALERDDATEYFLNFDGGDTYKASDWRIKFVLDFENTAAVDKFEEEYDVDLVKVMDDAKTTDTSFTKVIRAGSEITSDDLTIIKAIFNDADLVNDGADDDIVVGEVYVGTQSTTDISDDLSYNQFKDKYIETSENGRNVEDTDNGEWLKVIDNNGDGIADIVLKTEFAMSMIERISKDNEYTLAALEQKADAVEFKDTVKIDGDDIVTEDELAADDVVIYTLIDGKYYMNIAEMVTETVDKKGINSKTETMTCGGTDYVQSHIGYTDETPYLYDVTDAHTEETYDLYLDHFGFVRLYIESDYDAFMLLTDGYYETDKKNTEVYKAEYWNVDAAEKQEIDVVDNDAEFIDEDITAPEEGTWRRLNGADYTYWLTSSFVTNIAGYSVTDDGYNLINAEDTTRRADYDVQELDVDGDTDLDARLLYNENGDRVQTTTQTQYYLVIKDVDKYGLFVDTVLTWTGYANVPEDAALADWGTAAYAVTHAGTADYDVADVVVFETFDTADHNTYFVYNINNFNTIEHVWAVGYDDEGNIADDRIDVDSDWFTFRGPIEFYEIYDNAAGYVINKDYASYNIYAGTVSVEYDVSGKDYIQVDDTAAGFLRFDPAEITIYKVVKDSIGYYDYNIDVVDNWDDIKAGNHMILFTDSKENVEYAIIVEMSTYEAADGKDYIFSDVQALYDAIVADANYVEYDVSVINQVAGLTFELKDNKGNVELSANGTASVVPGDYTLTVTAKAGEENVKYWVTDDTHTLIGDYTDADDTFEIKVSGDVIIEITGETTTETFEVTAGTADNATINDLPQTVKYGASATFTVTADAGYSIDEVAANGVVLTPNADGSYTISNITAAQVVTVTTTANTNTVTFNYYDAEGALIVANTQETTVETGETKNVVLGTNTDEVYVVDDEWYAAKEKYTIAGVTEDVTIDVIVYDANVNVSVELADDADQDSYLTWTDASVAPATLNAKDGGEVTITLTSTEGNSSFNARVVKLTVNGVAETLNDVTGNDLTVTVPGELTENVEIVITYIGF